MFCIVWPETCPFQILLLKSTGSRDLGAHVLLSHGSCRHHEQQGQGSAVQLVPQSQGSRAVKMPGPAALGASWGCCCALLAAARDRHCPVSPGVSSASAALCLAPPLLAQGGGTARGQQQDQGLCPLQELPVPAVCPQLLHRELQLLTSRSISKRFKDLIESLSVCVLLKVALQCCRVVPAAGQRLHYSQQESHLHARLFLTGFSFLQAFAFYYFTKIKHIAYSVFTHLGDK